MTVEERFYSKATRNEDTGCLEWGSWKDKKDTDVFGIKVRNGWLIGLLIA